MWSELVYCSKNITPITETEMYRRTQSLPHDLKGMFLKIKRVCMDFAGDFVVILIIQCCVAVMFFVSDLLPHGADAAQSSHRSIVRHLVLYSGFNIATKGADNVQ